jgi:hypothetical protein
MKLRSKHIYCKLTSGKVAGAKTSKYGSAIAVGELTAVALAIKLSSSPDEAETGSYLCETVMYIVLCNYYFYGRILLVVR